MRNRSLRNPLRQMKRCCRWPLGALLLLAGCEPSTVVERFSVTLGMVELCTSHNGGEETCSEPEQESISIPVVVETTEQSQVVLYAAHPETGTDRAFSGSRADNKIDLSRVERVENQDTQCTFVRSNQLVLTIDEDKISGGERQIIDESAGCNELELQTTERREWGWKGKRQDEVGGA